jgi:hypothetical protein
VAPHLLGSHQVITGTGCQMLASHAALASRTSAMTKAPAVPHEEVNCIGFPVSSVLNPVLTKHAGRPNNQLGFARVLYRSRQLLFADEFDHGL